MPPDIFHINQRFILPTQRATMNGAGFQIKCGKRIDPMQQAIKPGCAEFRARQFRFREAFHQIAKSRALGAA